MLRGRSFTVYVVFPPADQWSSIFSCQLRIDRVHALRLDAAMFLGAGPRWVKQRIGCYITTYVVGGGGSNGWLGLGLGLEGHH